MLQQPLDARAEVGEPELVRRQYLAGLVVSELPQGRQEVAELVAGGSRPEPDVRGNPGQYVVAGQQDLLPLVVEAQVTRRVAGRPHGPQGRPGAERQLPVPDGEVPLGP